MPVIDLCCLVSAWLSLHAGVSRDTANIILKVLHFLIATTLMLIHHILASSGVVMASLQDVDIPQDIQTVYSRYNLNPEIVRTPCCLKCFKIYPNGMPQQCTWQRSPRSQLCGEKC